MGKNIKYFSLCMMLVALSALSCSKEESNVPTYLKLHGPAFSFTNGTGSTAQNIEDYWLYVGDELIGVFPVGSSAPVIGTGFKDIIIYAGVRTNGLRDNAYIYTFVEPYRMTVNLCACNEDVEVYPVFQYRPTAKFSFIEDFELTNIFSVDLDGDMSTSMKFATDTVFEGTSSGLLETTNSNKYNVVTTPTFYTDFASDGRDIFLELNVRSNIVFTIGLESKFETGSNVDFLLGVFPSKEWKKLYIDMTSLIQQTNATQGYRLVFSVVHPGGSTESKARVYVDNIKLLHY